MAELASVPFLGLGLEPHGHNITCTPTAFGHVLLTDLPCVSYTLVCYFKKGQTKKTLEFRHKFQDCRCLRAT